MGKKWTPEEDQKLIDLYKQYGKQWGVIAQKIQTRTASQVAARWEKCLDPSLTKGPFTLEEDQIIIDYVKNNGPQNWPGLSELMKNRSPKQCRERWFNHLDPNVSLKPWTSEEDELIFSNIMKCGKKWSIIAKFLPGRTANAIKNRWNSSISKRIVYGLNGSKKLAPDVSRRRLTTTKQIQNKSLQVSDNDKFQKMKIPNQQTFLTNIDLRSNSNSSISQPQNNIFQNQNMQPKMNLMMNNQMVTSFQMTQNTFNSFQTPIFNKQNQFIPQNIIQTNDFIQNNTKQSNQFFHKNTESKQKRNKRIPHFKKEAAAMQLQPIITNDPNSTNLNLNMDEFPQPPTFDSPILTTDNFNKISEDDDISDRNENQQTLLSPFSNFSLNSPKSPIFPFSPTQLNSGQFSLGSGLPFTPIFSPSNDQNWNANAFK